MEFSRVGLVVDVINARGLPAEPAWPSRWLRPEVVPQAQVWLHSGSSEEGTVTVGVTVLAGSAQECAVAVETAADALLSIGGEVRVDACRFDGTAGLFYTELRGEFLPKLPVKIGAVTLGHPVRFTAEQKEDQSNWSFTLVERFPPGAWEEVLPEAPFSIICRKDAYHSCQFVACKRVFDGAFITQTRIGTAQRRTVLEE